MNNTNFMICMADQAQRDHLLKHSVIKGEQERKNAIIYAAIHENDVIGWIIVKEQNVPAPITGKCWYIHYLFVNPEFRRKGIATALVTEIKAQAELLNIIYLYGFANPSLEASMFWLDQGVTMHPYGTMQNDINKPLYFGNYYHIFSYCIRRKDLCGDSCCIRTGTIAKDEIADLINKHVQNETKKIFLLSKANDLFGFAALGESNETKGVILALPDSMQAPLDSTRWWIFLFVDQQFRHQGIGRSLVLRLYQYAQNKEVIQLTGSATEDDIGFWYKLGFDVYFRGANSKGIMLAIAMIRIK